LILTGVGASLAALFLSRVKSRQHHIDPVRRQTDTIDPVMSRRQEGKTCPVRSTRKTGIIDPVRRG
jgi:hypothetical protein